MPDKAIRNDEFLLLTDENGNYFAIPRETVEQYHAKGEQKVRIEKALGDDVSGFTMYQQHINEFRTATYQAERRQEAAQERLARSSRSDSGSGSEEGSSGLKESGAGIGQMLTGMWKSLPFLRPTTTEP